MSTQHVYSDLLIIAWKQPSCVLKQVNEQIVVHPYNGMQFNDKKEKVLLDESSKRRPKKATYYIYSIHMTFWKR